MFNKHGANHDEISDVVSRLRDVGGVEFACVLREVGNDTIRGNLRSKTSFDCSVFAEQYGGGGHKRAAGFSIKGRQIDELADEIIKEASKFL
jgi:phosphoesterase RecJ-like protein